MSENTQLVPVSFLPMSSEWAMIKDVAKTIAAANGLSEGRMISVLITGRSLGLSIPASLELVQNISGKTSLAPRGALAMLHSNPLIKSIEIKRLEVKDKFIGYDCRIERANGFSYTGRFTMEQALQAGLIKAGGGWTTYPENMCLWRAVGFACDVAASDITCGLTAFMKMPEQFGVSLSETGDIIEGRVMVETGPTLDSEIERLTNAYGVEAVLVAGGGSIPTDLEKCAEIEDTIKRAIEMERQEMIQGREEADSHE